MNVGPLAREIPVDIVTPVGAFLRLANGAALSFVLENVVLNSTRPLSRPRRAACDEVAGTEERLPDRLPPCPMGGHR